ncbi:Golgi phosphoprotein 3-domain-containing protein [Halteromyces radiatus]|uniref:Golgi phosphoprotein 3-domain-containing protein n=1 Tax=Halteromyces radiatus TaxID=101107 RepID=UPI00221F3DE2|nr:Golgi phosphoprotein 3-domain-containing protein [Halteromyces radiatus]KAI8084801.1 Golgi phosphoprotein 3-domain-containing protein [Halteromyces radiatus]
MSTVTRRRVGASGSSNHPEDINDNSNNNNNNNNNNNSNSQKHIDSPSSEKKIAFDPRDLDESKANPKLTLMEEVLLLGLKDKQGYLSFWNDSISYALRGCIVMELAFRGRIAMVKDPNRRKYPLSDRHIEVINDKLTGEVLLDEALKMMKVSEKMSVASWIDLMSGETWNVMKIGYQLKQVRERLAKGLVDKGVLRTEKRNFLLFDMATHPVADTAVKGNLIKLVCMMLTTHVSPNAIEAVTDIPFAYLRAIAMICAAYAANVLENALLYLEPDSREHAFNKVDELMNDYSTWPFAGEGAKLDIPTGKELSLEVIASVLNVLTKMDAIL